MKCFSLTAAAAAAAAVAVAVVVATAAADSYVSASAPLHAGVLSSPSFLWIAANIIVVWLVSSYRGHTAAADDVSAAGGGDVDMGMYTSSPSVHDHEDVFAPAADLVVAAAPVVTTTVAKKKQPREARAAKRSTTDRPRARKSASVAGGDTTPARPDSPRDVSKALAGVVQTPRGAVAAEAARALDVVVVKSPILVAEEWLSWDLAATAEEATAKPDVKKSIVEEEWPDWAFFVEEAAKPAGAKSPLVGEEEWSAWVLACTEEAKPAVVEKEPVVAEEPWPSSWTIAATDVKMAVKKPVVVEDPWRTPSSWTIDAPEAKPADGEKWAITLATDYSTPKPDVVAGAGDDDDDVSMDTMWQTILQSGRARPVTVRKSETWATTTTDEQPRREIRKAATATNMTPPPSPPHVREGCGCGMNSRRRRRSPPAMHVHACMHARRCTGVS
uniref:Uncharacterized protein n=1 Tax=Oryza punctata TaxID=4537 RepID=A0A0E0M918_ORYPU